jgi:stage V sporulation protein B
MIKSKFISSTIILIIGGLITKVLGMVIKIITTRYVGLEGIGIYMLIMPTFNLFISLTQMGFPVAISKLVAEEKRRGKKIVLSTIPFSLIFNIILLILVIVISPMVSKLLNDERTLYPLISSGPMRTSNPLSLPI